MKTLILFPTLTIIFAIMSPESFGDEWQTKLQSVIREFDSDAEIVVEDGTYVYRHHTQTFKIHTVYKTGAIAELAHDEEGPKAEGILLKLTLQNGPHQGAADIPQEEKGPYWKTFSNAYPVASGKYLMMNLAYGSRTNVKLIDAIKKCFDPVLLSSDSVQQKH